MKYNLPVLYSFRRCPYAIRARMTLHYCQIKIEHREILLNNKPDTLLKISHKGTVPVLQLQDGTVLDESLDIMRWSLAKADPDDWLMTQQQNKQNEMSDLIDRNDAIFKLHLDHYKYSDRFPMHSTLHYQHQCEVFLQYYNTRLSQHRFLSSSHISIADIAIFPFVRQCAFVDKQWFDKLDYIKIQQWLDYFLNSSLFLSVMDKHKPFME